MFGNILGGIAKIFGGSAHEKALKEVQPVVDAINEYYNSYSSLSNDELRGKTTEFKSRIAEQLKDIDNQLLDIQNQLKELGNEAIDQKEQLFKEVADLEKSRDAKLEDVLKDLLPEAFATIKETARRFAENEVVSATATPLDRELATTKPHIQISGDQVQYANEWLAAGGKSSGTWYIMMFS